uniref:CHK kinase-like domain-containing protein n=1 Tax=Timema monikensis TaxID=170555 RepID=A0A7R9E8X2_9NEOP|nr:unnamed protein product [Timema monikensis]
MLPTDKKLEDFVRFEHGGGDMTVFISKGAIHCQRHIKTKLGSHLKELLESGIINRCSSLFANPLVCVINKDRSVKQTLPEGEMMKQCLENLQQFVCDSTFFSKMVYLVKPREPVAVLTHGDCWTNNILFHYSETGQILEKAYCFYSKKEQAV